MTEYTTKEKALSAAFSSQFSIVNRLNAWIKEALQDPEVGVAIAKNDALFARLQTIYEVCRATQANTMEQIEELGDGGEPA